MSDVPNIRKEVEFEEFLKLLEDETIAGHWTKIADILGIDKDTVTEWKKHPLAKEAIRKGIQEALRGMRESGRRDWRMWESKLKMLGIVPTEHTDLTSGGEKIVPILGGIGVHSNNSNEQTPEPNKEN